MPNSLLLQEIKRSILEKIGLKVISPSDCRVISISIQQELKKNVSETTIKRLFGFAEIKHQFSKFTINTLMEYANLTEDNNVNIGSSYLTMELDEDIEIIRNKSNTITKYTLQNIRNRCSVPYEMTIPRKFAKHDFEFFHSSKFSYTAFISQPGYGKSILLSHLVQELFIEDNAIFKNDITICLRANQLFNEEYALLNIDDIIKLKLGLYPNTNLVDYFNKQFQNKGIKLIVFLDGFNELISNKTLKPKILEKLITFIGLIDISENVKLIFGVRSTTWSRFYEKMRYSHFLKNKWFSGSYFNIKDNSNVPSLTENEVQQIFKKISHIDYSKISENLKTQLKFPFHIQWYYQLREEYPEFESYTNIIFYEIIARFIQEKIYNSTYATEKVLFCKKVIFLTNYGRKHYTVLKTDLIKEMPVFKNAYMELLADGILMEEKQSKSGFPTEVVRFVQPHIFEYFLFIELFDLFNQKMDSNFFELINTEYKGNQVRFQLLQWSVRLLIKLNQFAELKAVLDLNLSNYEKNYLVYFIAENLNYRYKSDPTIIKHIKEQGLHDILIGLLLNFDFIDSSYKASVKCLISVTDDTNTEIIYQTILAVFDCLSIDKENLIKRIFILEELESKATASHIKSSKVIKLIYDKLDGNTSNLENAELQIQNFKHSVINSGSGQLDFPNTEEIINYLIIFILNIFYGTPQETTKIVYSIFKNHPKLKKSRGIISIYLLNVMAQASARYNPGKKTDQVERILDYFHSDKSSINLTSYSQSIFLSLKTEQSKNRGDYNAALKYAEECIKIYIRNDLALNEVLMYNTVINIYNELKDYDKVEEYTYKKLNLLHTKHIDLPLLKINSHF